MKITNEELKNIIQEELQAFLSEDMDEAKSYHWDEPDWEYGGGYGEGTLEEGEIGEAKKKKPCKKAKGKKFVKRVNGKCRSYGDSKGKIASGTKKGDAYCARSAKIKKCKNPPCANDLSRKKWKCRGSKSMK